MDIYRVRKDHATHGGVVQNNLHSYRTNHRNMIYRVRKNEYATLNEVFNNNLQADGTNFSIHVRT